MGAIATVPSSRSPGPAAGRVAPELALVEVDFDFDVALAVDGEVDDDELDDGEVDELDEVELDVLVPVVLVPVVVVVVVVVDVTVHQPGTLKLAESRPPVTPTRVKV
jgi:hypothetical protein